MKVYIPRTRSLSRASQATRLLSKNHRPMPSAEDQKNGRNIMCVTFVTPDEAEQMTRHPLFAWIGLEERSEIARRGSVLHFAFLQSLQRCDPLRSATGKAANE